MEKTFTATEIGKAINNVQETYGTEPTTPGYVLSSLEHELGIE
jgi:hypothetical protein